MFPPFSELNGKGLATLYREICLGILYSSTHIILSWILDESECWYLYSGQFPPKNEPLYPLSRRLGGLRADLEAVEK
jgi:hypothetical protein